MQNQEHQPELRGAWRKSHVAFSFKYLNGRIELTDEARTVSHARKNQVQMQQIRNASNESGSKEKHAAKTSGT